LGRRHKALSIASAVGAAILAQPLAAQETEEIVGYLYNCRAKAGEAPQTIEATLYLDETGAPQSFAASHSHWTAVDSSFRGERPANVSRDATNLRWSLDWNIRFETIPPRPYDPQFSDAAIRLDFSSWRKLPVKLVMLAGGDSLYLPFDKPLFAFSSRWPGW